MASTKGPLCHTLCAHTLTIPVMLQYASGACLSALACVHDVLCHAAKQLLLEMA